MATPFLQEIAQHFADTHTKELYKYRFFFPNRRAGLFFQHYLRQALSNRPALLPEITTVNEYLRRILHLPDEDVNNDLFITFELCQVFNELMGKEHARTFNDFYYLGGLILADFNDIDKHLLPVDRVFRNVTDYQKLEGDLSFLSTEQQETLRNFFGYRGFLENPKEYQQKFIEFWEALPQLYHRTKAQLSARGLHYDGMLMREVVEQLDHKKLSLVEDESRPVFVGLNALTPCEIKIFNHFRDIGGAIFYWDYASDLLQSRSLAGAFRNNQELYPMPPEGTADHIDFADTPKGEEQSIDIVALPSEVAQSVYIGDLLKTEDLDAQIDELKVAVILPSERLLIPLLSNIPSELPSLNVTMGYPIRELPDVSMLIRLIELRMLYHRRDKEWRGEEVREILSMNPLYKVMGAGDFAQRCVKKLVDERWFFLSSDEFLSEVVPHVSHTGPQEELVQLLFRDITDSGEKLLVWVMDTVDFLSRQLVHTQDEEGNEVYSGSTSVLPFLSELLEKQRLSMNHYAEKHPLEHGSLFAYEVVQDLLLTLLRQSRIPYRGEPLKGLQVMGVLETRGLDFETVIIPDAAEDILPSKTRLMGVIPYTIRQGLQLPTYKWQDQTRAYNFFRLISRAKRIVATFDTRRNDHSGGEPSRYITLLEHIYGRKVNKINANFPLRFDRQGADNFVREQEAVDAYVTSITTGDGKLSASKINGYLQCPRLFYYTTILGIEEREEMEELVSERDMGTLVHNTIQQLYLQFEGQLLDKLQISRWLDEETHIKTVLEIQYEELFRRKSKKITGMNAITVHRAESLVRNVLKIDTESLTEIHYIGGEVKFEYQFKHGDKAETVNLKGFIDRLDYVIEDGETVLRVVDYKTGRDTLEVNLDDVTDEKKPFNHAACQLFFYSFFLSNPTLARTVIADHHKDLLPSTYCVRPLIIKPKIANDGLLTLSKGDTLSDFGTVSEKYELILREKLSEITDTSNPFRTTPLKKSCRYCPARDFCTDAKVEY